MRNPCLHHTFEDSLWVGINYGLGVAKVFHLYTLETVFFTNTPVAVPLFDHPSRERVFAVCNRSVNAIFGKAGVTRYNECYKSFSVIV